MRAGRYLEYRTVTVGPATERRTVQIALGIHHQVGYGFIPVIAIGTERIQDSLRMRAGRYLECRP